MNLFRRPFSRIGAPAALACTALAPAACGSGGDADRAGPEAGSPAPAVERGPRAQPGTALGLYAPEQHDLYDGRFVISGGRIHQVGTLNDDSPWDHMGNDGSNLRPVGGTAEIDVNEIENTGTLDGEPLRDDHQIHFMVTQGMRGRDLVARYPLDSRASEAGAVNPALQQLDFYVRSPERNEANHPQREVFDHFFAMEVTWK